MQAQPTEFQCQQILKQKNQFLLNQAKSILICGAGPVGLVTAIQISLHFPHVEITILDLIRRFQKVGGKWKNLQFPRQMKGDQIFSRRRGQVVTIRDDCRDLFPFFKNILTQRFPNRVWGSSTNVPIRQLEDVLMEYAQSSRFTNIKFQFDQDGSAKIKQILNNQNVDLVIGCDGAGSKVRQQLAPQPSKNNLHPDCIIDGKRYICGTDYVLGAYVDQTMKEYRMQNNQMPAGEKLYHYHALLTMTQMRFLLNAYYPTVSNNDDVKGIRGFLNVRLSQIQYNSLATAGNTIGVKCNFIDPALTTMVWRQNQNGLLNLNETQRNILTSAFSYYGLNAIKNCGFIYLFQLKPGFSSEFGFTYKKKYNKEIPIFLCGDAAISHHFWPGRGLNTGLKSASFLLDCLCYPKIQAINNYNVNMKRLAQREILQRSVKFCQFNGKWQSIPPQMSLFDKRCGNGYIGPKQNGAIKPSQIQKWKKQIHKRILQLKQGSFRSNGTRGVPAWPNLSLTTDQKSTFKKLQAIEEVFIVYLPRIFRNVIYSGRWYLQGVQPEIFSKNIINRKCLMVSMSQQKQEYHQINRQQKNINQEKKSYYQKDKQKYKHQQRKKYQQKDKKEYNGKSQNSRPQLKTLLKQYQINFINMKEFINQNNKKINQSFYDNNDLNKTRQFVRQFYNNDQNLIKKYYVLNSQLPEYNQSSIGWWKQRYNIDLNPKAYSLYLQNRKLNIQQFLKNANYHHIQYLNIGGYGCEMNNKEWKMLAQNASSIKNMKILNLSDNKISQILQEDLQKFLFVQYFCLQNNPLSKKSISELNKYNNKYPKVKIIYTKHQYYK